jgi:hypothetical protein
MRQSAKSRAASTKTLAMPLVRSLTLTLSSNHAAIANASRCCSLTSSASCGWVASGYAALVARKTNSRSLQLHRTCDG